MATHGNGFLSLTASIAIPSSLLRSTLMVVLSVEVDFASSPRGPVLESLSMSTDVLADGGGGGGKNSDYNGKENNAFIREKNG